METNAESEKEKNNKFLVRIADGYNCDGNWLNFCGYRTNVTKNIDDSFDKTNVIILRPPFEGVFNIQNNETKKVEYIFDAGINSNSEANKPFIIEGSIDKENGCFQMNKHEVAYSKLRSFTHTKILPKPKIYDPECSEVITVSISQFEYTTHKIKMFGKVFSFKLYPLFIFIAFLFISGLVISMLLLFATVLIFATEKRLQNFRGKLVIFYTFTLALFHVIWILEFIYGKNIHKSVTLCETRALASYCLLMMIFCWLTTLNFETYSTFR